MQAAFNDHQTGNNENEGDFGFGLGDIGDLDMNNGDNDNELGMNDLNDIFNTDPFGGDGVTSPNGSTGAGGTGLSQPGSPGSNLPGSDPAFRSVEQRTKQLDIVQYWSGGF